MTNHVLSQPGSLDKPRAALVPVTGHASDIIELVMADHRRIRRLCEAMRDTARRPGGPDPRWVPGHVWQRLSGLLIAHFEAEEEICYLPMFGAVLQAGERRREAVADHDDIREVVTEASLRPAGSAPWWRAVRRAMADSAEHLDREERGVLAECLPRLNWNQREVLAHQWLAFIAARTADSGTHQPYRNGPGAGPGNAPHA